MLQIDTDLLVFINQHYTDFLDAFMWNLSQRSTWIALYVAMAVCVVYRYRWRGLYLIGAIAVAVLFADQLSSALLKPLVCRLRPTHEPMLDGVLHIVNGYRGGMFGFPSSHAANTMAVALLYSMVWKDWRHTLPLMLWVGLNCYSRMYLAVHYPLDILAGLVLGSIVAIVLNYVLKKTNALTISTNNHKWYVDYSVPAVFALTLLLCAVAP